MLRNLILMGALTGMCIPTDGDLRAQTPAPTPSQEGEETYVGESAERYVQVKHMEGQGIVRKGELEEVLERGVPLTEGDVVESRGRGVLQLADGTRIAFGDGARFTLAALFMERNDERHVLLRLDRGTLRVQVGSQSETNYRIDTPSGRATFRDRGSVSLEVEGDRSVRMKVYSGRVRFTTERDRATLSAGERLTIYSDQDNLDRVLTFNTYDKDGFESWAAPLLTVRRGESYGQLPREIRYYADDLDEHGEWVQVDEIGTRCWRPLRVSVDWRPYWRGRWGAYNCGMTWISDDPWGYATYHFGRWDWSGRWGWYWIPGRHYSPAWVAWRMVDSFFGWAPLGYWNHPVRWGYGAWSHHHCWNVVDIGHLHRRSLHGVIYSESRVIDHFSRGARVDLANTVHRGVGREWIQTPLLVKPSEWRDPNNIVRTAMNRDLQRTRLAEREREVPGRRILERTPVTPADRVTTLDGVRRVPFDRAAPTPGPRVPISRDRGADTVDGGGVRRTDSILPPDGGRRDEGRGADRVRPRPDEGRRDEVRPTDPRREDRTQEPRREDRRIDLPRDEARPRPEPRRDDMRPIPRIEPRRDDFRREEPRREESRPIPPRVESRREEPRREESRPAPRVESRREESRPAPPPPRAESRPAPPPPPPPPPRTETRREESRPVRRLEP